VRVPAPAAADGATVRFSVEDSGEGIPAEHLPRIFERFYRVPGRSAADGAGLGLAIAKDILEAHGGTISAQSRPGEGSTFTFTLPAAASVSTDTSTA
jgi:signal transduction histidine kinase